MADELEMNEALQKAAESQERSFELLEKLFSAASRPEAVYGAPIQVGELTVITASEVAAGGGLGFGVGGGSAPSDEEGEAEVKAGTGFGGGGGGGGGSKGRPVAVIEIGPEGVRVEPVVDVTKLGLALFTALGSMFLMFSRMRKASRG